MTQSPQTMMTGTVLRRVDHERPCSRLNNGPYNEAYACHLTSCHQLLWRCQGALLSHLCGGKTVDSPFLSLIIGPMDTRHKTLFSIGGSSSAFSHILLFSSVHREHPRLAPDAVTMFSMAQNESLLKRRCLLTWRCWKWRSEDTQNLGINCDNKHKHIHV